MFLVVNFLLAKMLLGGDVLLAKIRKIEIFYLIKYIFVFPLYLLISNN